jgi:hypothetical protein
MPFIKTYLVGYPTHKHQTGTPFDVSVSNLVGGTTMTRRRTIAFGLSGIFLLWLLMTGRAEEGMFFIFGDAMDWRSRSLAGWHAINCGTVRTHRNPAAATSCALKAQSEGRPFPVRYNIIGIDSDVAAGLVRTPDGHLYGIGFTGNIFGQGGTSLRLQRVGQKPCPEPLHLYVNARGRLNCFEQQPSRNIMDENAEPY